MNINKNNYYKIISAIGLLLTILWVIFVNTKPYSDFQYYNGVAQQVASGGQWGDTYTSVGYSIILGFVYKIFGSNIMIAKIFNIILTLCNYFILFKLLKSIDIDEKVRKIMFTIFVLFPNNIFYNSILATEIIFTTIFLEITFLYFSKIKNKYIFIGILTGINAMIKPFFLVFFLAVFLMELINREKFLYVIRNSLVILLVSLITISPWVYRNTKLIGQFTFISNNGGIVLYINNNSQNNTGRWMPASDVENSVVKTKKYINANMTQKNKMLSDAAKKWIISHPVRFIELGFKRVFNTYYTGDDILYSFYGTGISSSTKNLVMEISFVLKMAIFIPATLVIILSSIKILISIFRRAKINSFLLYNIICYFMITCAYFVSEGQARYSFPVIFIMIYLFSICIKKLTAKLNIY